MGRISRLQDRAVQPIAHVVSTAPAQETDRSVAREKRANESVYEHTEQEFAGGVLVPPCQGWCSVTTIV